MKNLSVRNEDSDIPCKADVDARLKNVPNVGTNDQTPTYSTATTLAKLVTGEKLGVAFGKIAKAVDELITHLSDSVKHITSEERTAWNGKAAGNHTHSNMTAATASTAGKAGLVPAPAAGKQISFLRGDGTWQNPSTSNFYNYGFMSADAAYNGYYKILSATAAETHQVREIHIRICSANSYNYQVGYSDVYFFCMRNPYDAIVSFSTDNPNMNILKYLYIKKPAGNGQGEFSLFWKREAPWAMLRVQVVDQYDKGGNWSDSFVFPPNAIPVNSIEENGFVTAKCSDQFNSNGTNEIYVSGYLNTLYPAATTTAAGLMSAADKTKFDGGYMVKSDSNGLYVEY